MFRVLQLAVLVITKAKRDDGLRSERYASGGAVVAIYAQRVHCKRKCRASDTIAEMMALGAFIAAE